MLWKKLMKTQRYNSIVQLFPGQLTIVWNKTEHRYYRLIDRLYRLTFSYVFVFEVRKFKCPPPMTTF